MRKLLLLLFPFAAFAQQPAYYEGIDFKQNGKAIKEELHNLINATHHAVSYTPGVWNILDKSDLDLDSQGRVLLIYGFTDNSTIYSEQRTRDVNNKNNTGGNANGKWEREHVFPKSLANPVLDTRYPGTGTDAHNLRAVDRQINSTRSNNAYREKWTQDVTGQAKLINGGFYPGDEWTGDVARIIMYMYVHYGMETDPQLVAYNKTTSNDDRMPDMFLKWNVQDKVSEFEKVRNEIIAETQGSRNPFIDNPYLATLIWGGDKAENTWTELSANDYNYQQTLVEVFPNPTTDKVKINAKNFDYVNLYDFNGRLLGIELGSEVNLKNYPAGMYILSIHLKDGNIVTKKVIKK
ncbi:endonuclease [Empedobacter falsenii]|uniref:endonuclease n=1 Tax=Empedobacter falsenii TaxID=343874 RepID=UPI001C583D09|nr:endonuclease [Empedobacter falsenii]MBW1617138.1 T9SS type A sorting domain-containing protein [Empedobacter falsenii]